MSGTESASDRCFYRPSLDEGGAEEAGNVLAGEDVLELGRYM